MDIVAWVALISSVLTIWLGLFSIESWRREHQGKRRVELAEETLTLFYEIYDVVRYVRSPISLASETEEVVQGEHEHDDEYRARKSASIVFVRFNKHKELFSKLQALRYRFRAAFGDDKAKPFEDLRAITSEIQLSARMLAHLWKERAWRVEAQQEDAIRQAEKYEKVFWEYGEDDETNVKLKAVIADIEKSCRDVIDARGTLYSFFNWQVRLSRKKS